MANTRSSVGRSLRIVHDWKSDTIESLNTTFAWLCSLTPTLFSQINCGSFWSFSWDWTFFCVSEKACFYRRTPEKLVDKIVNKNKLKLHSACALGRAVIRLSHSSLKSLVRLRVVFWKGRKLKKDCARSRPSSSDIPFIGPVLPVRFWGSPNARKENERFFGQ